MNELEALFWPKVEKSDGCWAWHGRVMTSRRGTISYGGKRLVATHVSWFLHQGEWPLELGKWALHTCDNPNCVNPAHLFLGTVKDNARDCAAKKRNPMQVNPGRLQGSRNGFAKLTEEKVREIRRRHKAGDKNAQIAADMGITKEHVIDVANGRSWWHVK